MLVEPYRGAGEWEGTPAYTVAGVDLQLPCVVADLVPVTELWSRAMTAHPYGTEGFDPENIWAALWAERVTEEVA